MCKLLNGLGLGPEFGLPFRDLSLTLPFFPSTNGCSPGLAPGILSKSIPMSALGDSGAESVLLVWTEKEGVESQAVKLDNDVMVSQLCESALESGLTSPLELGLMPGSLRF